MFAFVARVVAKPRIEYGTHALTESPLIHERCDREIGYCTTDIGTLESGNSFSTKPQLIRRAMEDPGRSS